MITTGQILREAYRFSNGPEDAVSKGVQFMQDTKNSMDLCYENTAPSIVIEVEGVLERVCRDQGKRRENQNHYRNYQRECQLL